MRDLKDMIMGDIGMIMDLQFEGVGGNQDLGIEYLVYIEGGVIYFIENFFIGIGSGFFFLDIIMISIMNIDGYIIIECLECYIFLCFVEI